MAETRTIVTAADTAYWRSLYQMLLSAERRKLTGTCRFIAYDLGIEPRLLDRLKRRFGWCEFRRFDFDRYPPHFALASQTYAWKPVIINLVAAEGGLVLWLDSATLFQTSDLEPVWSVIARGGLYITRGQSPLEQRCDPLVLTALDVPFAMRRRPELVTGVLGFNPRLSSIHALLAEWQEMALTASLIAPRTPRLAFHRPEQSLLTVLIYRREGAQTLPDAQIDISCRAPIRWMTSRNKVPPWMPPAADLAVRAYYRSYKTIDQALWKLKHFRDTRIHGWHRYAKEHFSVFVRRGSDGKTVRLQAPRHSYYADPFLLQRDDGLWLLAERFDYPVCKGSLCALKLDGDLNPGPPIPLLEGRAHLSFPFPFLHQGRLYLIPETSADRCIEIHACEEFPARWRLACRAVENVDAADSVLLRHDGLWWIITSLRIADEGSGRFLAIYFAEDFERGPWRAHPVNAQRLYQRQPFSSGRNAGAIFTLDGKLIRPAQDSRHYYGEGMRLMAIETLTPASYRETPFVGEHAVLDLVNAFSPHHLSMDGGCTAFDIRDRAWTSGSLWPVFGKFPRGRSSPR